MSYNRVICLLISFLLPFNSHQTFFRTNKHQNFYALKKPVTLPGPLPQPQPLFLSNQMQSGSSMPPGSIQQNLGQPSQPPPQMFQQPNPQQNMPQANQIHKNLLQSPNPNHPQNNLPQMPQMVQHPISQQQVAPPLPPQMLQTPSHPTNHLSQYSNSQQAIQQPPPQMIQNQQHPQMMHPQQQMFRNSNHPQMMQPGKPPHNMQHPPQMFQKPPQMPQQLMHPPKPPQNMQSPHFPLDSKHLQQNMLPPPQVFEKPNKLGNQPLKSEMHHLHPPKNGPLSMNPFPQPNKETAPIGAIPISPSPPSIHNQKVGIPPGYQPAPGMMPPLGLTTPPSNARWMGLNKNSVFPSMVLPNTAPQMDLTMTSFQPMGMTSQPLFTMAITTAAPQNTTLIPVLAVDNVTTPIEVDTHSPNDVNETRLVFTQNEENRTHEEPWQPIISDKLDFNDDLEGQVQFVMSHVNSSSNEETESLPENQALVGGHPPGNFRKGEFEKPGKLESIKRGIYGILFGRKGPPDSNGLRQPSMSNVNLGPHPASRWQPLENKLQMLTNNRRHQQEKITCKMFTIDVCLEVNDYPFDIIMGDLMRNTREVNDMYADVANQERLELMDGISLSNELSFDKQHYYGNDNSHSHRDYGLEGGNVCPSEVTYARPRKGRKINGEWKYIVNVPQFPQTVRLERCLKPNSRCSYVDAHLQSQCSQLHTLQRTLVWDLERGLHIEVLMFPSACSCYLLPFYDKSKLNESNDIPLNWSDDTIRDNLHIDVALNDNDTTGTRRRKFTRTSSLLGPYTRTLQKYSRDELLDKDLRPHTNFGRPLVAEKSYLDGEEGKINLNQHSTSDYILPWN